jgi:hypothetical protein
VKHLVFRLTVFSFFLCRGFVLTLRVYAAEGVTVLEEDEKKNVLILCLVWVCHSTP